MSWSNNGSHRDYPGKIEESACKKRKLEIEVKEMKDKDPDEWDDDDEMALTQADLETLDQMASQVYSQSQVVNQASAFSTAKNQECQSSFLIPSNPKQSVKMTTSSSSSELSIQPLSTSSRSSSISNGSLSSNSSNGKSDSPKDLIQKLQLELEQTRKAAQEEKYLSKGELNYLRQCVHKQEAELEKLRAQREELLEQQKLVKSEKIHNLEMQVDSLTTQKQFKEREFQELNMQYQSLQQKLRKLELTQQQKVQIKQESLLKSPNKCSPRKIHVQPSPPSKQHKDEAALSQQQGFPTRLSFMDQSATTRASSSTLPSTSKDHLQSAAETRRTATPTHTNDARTCTTKRFVLNARTFNGGYTSGTQIVHHLLEAYRSHDDHQWNSGLTDLVKTTSHQASRGNDSLTSPLKAGRHGKSLVSGTSQAPDSSLLALDGLLFLLEDKAPLESQPLLKNYLQQLSQHVNVLSNAPTTSSSNKPTTGTNNKGNTNATVTNSVTSSVQTQITEATLRILPLLSDYINHYIKLVQNPALRAQGSSLSTSFSSSTSLKTSLSFSASFDSGCEKSGGRSMPQDRATAETLAYSAAGILNLILELQPAAGRAILSSTLAPSPCLRMDSSDHTSSCSTGDTEQKAKTSSGTAADDESSSMSEIRVIVGPNSHIPPPSVTLHQGSNTNLLFLLLRLASQEESHASPVVVRQVLKTLTLLVQCSTEEHLHKLETFISWSVLATCLKPINDVPVLVWSLKLVHSLTRYEKLYLRLCTRSETCPLYLMHKLCTGVKDRDMMEFYKEYMSCVFSIMVDQRTGLTTLLTNKCPCSDEFVEAVLLSLCQMLDCYKACVAKGACKPSLLNTLAQSVTLLHVLDTQLPLQSCAFKLQYLRLVSGLAAVLKPHPQEYEFQLLTLEELNDSESDQDMLQETGDTMET
ncbi:uncharacterized protein LOC131934655 [Physella acuta]|uniref:uncharacterized protein LOC131934655 n=1 Tax=Physella acuta TaxID=109671 RepID=UPI0027DD58FF|nr:uncharacterized protein LOC131934655 [Physella acuta]